MYTRQINRTLHDEHLATIAAWGRLERQIAVRGTEQALRAPDGDLAAALRDCAALLEGDITRHFEFEEQEIFPRLTEAGEGDIAGLLAEEHETVRAAAREFAPLAAAALRGELQAPGARRLQELSLELAERLVTHVQKEEMALLPALEDLLDEDADTILALRYCA